MAVSANRKRKGGADADEDDDVSMVWRYAGDATPGGNVADHRSRAPACTAASSGQSLKHDRRQGRAGVMSGRAAVRHNLKQIKCHGRLSLTCGT